MSSSLCSWTSLSGRVQRERRLLRLLQTRLKCFKCDPSQWELVLRSWDVCREVCYSSSQKSFLVSVAFNVALKVDHDYHLSVQWLRRALSLCIETQRLYPSPSLSSTLLSLVLSLCELYVATGDPESAGALLYLLPDLRVEKWLFIVLVAPFHKWDVARVSRRMVDCANWSTHDLLRMLKAVEEAPVHAWTPILEAIEKREKREEEEKTFMLIKFVYTILNGNVDESFQILAGISQLVSCSMDADDQTKTVFRDDKRLSSFLDACQYLVDCLISEENHVAALGLCEVIVFICQRLKVVERRDFFLLRQLLLIMHTEQQSSDAARKVTALMRDYGVDSGDSNNKFGPIQLKVALSLHQMDDVRFLLHDVFHGNAHAMDSFPRVFLVDLCSQLSELSPCDISQDQLVTLVELLHTSLIGKAIANESQMSLMCRVLARGYVHQLQVDDTLEDVAVKLSKLTIQSEDGRNTEWLTSLCWNLAISVPNNRLRYILSNAVAEVADRLRVQPLVIASRVIQVAAAISIIEENAIDLDETVLASLPSLFTKTSVAMKASDESDDVIRSNQHLLLMYQMKISLLLLFSDKDLEEVDGDMLDPNKILDQVELNDLQLQHLIIGVMQSLIGSRGNCGKVQELYLRALKMASETFDKEHDLPSKGLQFSGNENEKSLLCDAVVVKTLIVLDLLRSQNMDGTQKAVKALVALISNEQTVLNTKSKEEVSKASLGLWNCSVMARLHKDYTKGELAKKLSQELTNALANAKTQI